MTDLFFTDDGYHGGAFMLAANFNFYSFFKPRGEPAPPPKNFTPFDYGTTDGYDFFLKMGPLAEADKLYFHGQSFLWLDQVKHNTYDAYWQARDLSRHMHGIKCAVLTVGGWFDAEDLSGPFKTFHAIEKNNPGIFNALVVGPVGARRLGAAPTGDRPGRRAFRRQHRRLLPRTHRLPVLRAVPASGDGDAKLPEGLRLRDRDQRLAAIRCLAARKRAAQNPLLPRQRPALVPASGGNAGGFRRVRQRSGAPGAVCRLHRHRRSPGYMLSDQRFAARRPDVLVYQTEPLAEDVTLVGPVAPRLHVSTTGTDSDFVVKLIDVYPTDFPDQEQPGSPPPQVRDVPLPTERMGGYQQLVRGEPMRGKFRKSWERPEAFIPGKVEEINSEMPDVNHTFRRGHRIMVQVQSSWFPLVDLNPQTFVTIPDAKPGDFHKATERVYRTRAAPSGVAVQVLGPEAAR